MNFQKSLGEAASYWERKRMLYNAVLVFLVLVCWGPEILLDGPRGWIGGGLVVLAFGVIANALFSLVYPVDMVLQMTPMKPLWLRARWILFTSGTLLASLLALYVMLGNGMA